MPGGRCGRRWSRSGSCCTVSTWTTDVVSVPVVFHPATRLHNPGPGHPERPERIEAVLAALRAPDLTATVAWVDGRPATRDELERVHAPGYLDALESLARGGGGALDADTVVSRDSWDAALAAAGAAIGAVEQGIERGSGVGAPPSGSPARGVCAGPPRRRGRGRGRMAAGPAPGLGRFRFSGGRSVGRVYARAGRHGALDERAARARRAGAGRRAARRRLPARPARRRRARPRARACLRGATSRYYSCDRHRHTAGIQALARQHLSAARRGRRAGSRTRPAA